VAVMVYQTHHCGRCKPIRDREPEWGMPYLTCAPLRPVQIVYKIDWRYKL